jgi:hypothetical protein
MYIRIADIPEMKPVIISGRTRKKSADKGDWTIPDC